MAALNIFFVVLVIGVVVSMILLAERFADETVSSEALIRKLRNWSHEGPATRAFVLIFVPAYALAMIVPFVMVFVD